MNRLVSALLVSSTLFLAQSCSTPVQSGDASVEGDKHHGHHNHNEHGHHHGSHGHGNKPSVKTKAILTTPSTITLDKPNDLVIDIQDSEGNAVGCISVLQKYQNHDIIESVQFLIMTESHELESRRKTRAKRTFKSCCSTFISPHTPRK